MSAVIGDAALEMHPSLLYFFDGSLEKRYKLHHNDGLTRFDRAAGLFGTVVILLYYMLAVAKGRSFDYAAATQAYLVFALLCEYCIVQSRHHFIRPIFAYGMTSILWNSLENKVRFHLELCCLLLLNCMSVLAMVLHEGRPSLWLVALHSIICLYIPAFISYTWDRRVRRQFLETMRGRPRALLR